MTEIELKEEEELKQNEEALKKWEGELRIREEQLEKRKKMCYIISLYTVGSTLCVVISINIRCNPNLFHVSYLKFIYNCFLKFIVHKVNSEMVKSGMVMLTERENADVGDADVAVR
jgi:hypothetical protein